MSEVIVTRDPLKCSQLYSGNKNPAIADGVASVGPFSSGVTSGTTQPALPFPELGLV